MKLWEKVTKRIVNRLETLTGSQLTSKLRKAGYKVNPKKLGWLMKDLGFTSKQVTRQGKRVREYTKPVKPSERVIGFYCYYSQPSWACKWNGYYKLQRGERRSQKDDRVIVNDLGVEKVAVCPRCHPPGTILPFEGVHFVKFYKHGYRKEDGPVRFRHEYEPERLKRGWPTERGYHGPGQLEPGPDFHSPY